MPQLIETKYGIRIIVDFILLLVVAIPILLMFLLGKPFERGFYCDDDSIRYPYQDSTISTAVLYIVGTALPLLAIVVLEVYSAQQERPGKRIGVCGRELPAYAWRVYCNIGVFLFGCAVSQLLTDIAKYTIGRLRPHFLDICNPDWSTIDCTRPGLYILPDCNPVDEAKFKDSRLSFPSGHASFSAFTMVYLMLYLQARLNVRIKLLRPFLQFICFALTFYTSLSRISDYKHHWSDVFFGASLGILVAILMARFVADLRCQVTGRPRNLITAMEGNANATNNSTNSTEMQNNETV